VRIRGNRGLKRYLLATALEEAGSILPTYQAFIGIDNIDRISATGAASQSAASRFSGRSWHDHSS
jgi:hypothetical protein